MDARTTIEDHEGAMLMEAEAGMSTTTARPCATISTADTRAGSPESRRHSSRTELRLDPTRGANLWN